MIEVKFLGQLKVRQVLIVSSSLSYSVFKDVTYKVAAFCSNNRFVCFARTSELIGLTFPHKTDCPSK